MKKTQLIELLHNIRGTIVSFLSIAMFVALGVAVYLGIHWSAMAVDTTSEQYFEQQSFHDFEVVYPYGITSADLDDIKGVEGVSEVEAGYTSYQTFDLDGKGYVAHVTSLMSQIDKPCVLEGSLPVAADELAIDSVFATSRNIKVGDVISFDQDSDSADDQDGMKYLTARTYHVSAIVSMPTDILTLPSARGMTNLSVGAADCFVVLPTSSFDVAAFDGCFPRVAIRCSSLRGLSSIGSDYRDEEDLIKMRLESLGETKAGEREQAIRDAAQSKIDDAQAQIDAAQAQIDEKEKELTLGQAQESAGEMDLASAQELVNMSNSLLSAAQTKVDSAQSQLDDAQAQLNDAHDQLSSYQAQLDDAQATIDSKIESSAEQLKALGAPGETSDIASNIRAILNLAASSDVSLKSLAKAIGIPDQYIDQYVTQADADISSYRTFLEKKQELADGWSTYNDKQETLSEKQTELDTANQELSALQSKLDSAAATLASKQDDLDSAKTTISDGQTQLDDAKSQLADAQTQLQAAKDELSLMLSYKWSVSGREVNAGVVGIKSYVDVTDRMRVSMASLFLLVGLLVCYTAISRIVREQMVSIGTKKALGLRSREITLSYLAYSAIGVVLGVAGGVAVAVYLFEAVIDKAAVTKFTLGSFPPYVSLPDVAQIAAVEFVLIMLATWSACRTLLRRQAVQLLKGEEPPTNKARFYEKWPAWDRLSLYSQSIINNFFNDKLRVTGTLVGVAGCTALVVTAMTLYGAIHDAHALQGNVTSYDLSVIMDDPTSDQESGLLDAVEQTGAKGATLLRRACVARESDGALASMIVNVPEDYASFFSIYHVNALTGPSKVAELDDSGVWISQAFAEHQHVSAGDTITLFDSTMTAHEVKIAGVFEYHLNHHELIMSKTLYKQTFGVDAVSNTILIDSNGVDESTIVSKVQGLDGFFTERNEQSLAEDRFKSYQSLTTTMVWVYLSLSGLMALMVLLNLTVMFIEEKKRDLIVLMINGFSVRDAKRYIYRDSIVLVIVGIVLGILVGMAVGYFTVMATEFGMDSFIHTPRPLACVSGAVVCAIFAFLVNVIALRRIPRFSLTDINKV